ncbi:MAG TPA: amino acid adenylation domain-containing protein, partial [Pyrinomonadaceae bacterium]|nr:amino acid adenylation domain-containing protein [Pyrinomonadaceae bacterium]
REQSFITLLKRVREVCLDAYAHQEVPFERVVEELHPDRNSNHAPLFRVLFALQNTPTHELALADLKLAVLEPENPAARFDLALEVSETNTGELDCRLTFDADLFAAATIARMADYFINVLSAVTADPQQPISTINFLRDEERRQLLFDWNRTHADFPNTRCIHELFEHQAALTPEATAVVCATESLSYRKLNERANQWAHRLRSLGAGPEKLVGITAERSMEMIVGILAILKAGAAYVPLSPDTPPERLEQMLTDAGIELLLTQEQLKEQLPASESRQNPETITSADNLAYLIYTSGSTGRPKAVEVTHRNLVHSTTARFVYYDEPVRSFMLVSPFFFDSSVAGIFWTLCQGGKLVLPPKNFERDFTAFATLLEAEQVSHLLCLPMVHSLLLGQASHNQLKNLRTVIVAGEPCPPELPNRHFEALPHASLFNEYGPTEGTVWATVYKCAPHERATTVPIGSPVPNVQTYVLDESLQPVPVGVVGELYIGGEGVARGYRNHAASTAGRFVPHPFASTKGARLYATGDLARYLPDGELEFLGRRDQQIKVRGFRIELGEIEAVLTTHPLVREAVVVKHESRTVAYLTAIGPTEDLREFLQERLPEYMIPSQFVLLDAMPLGPNGKVDRKALPAPDASRPALRSAYAAPQTRLEQTIAEVWQEFLQLDTVGVNDSFFELGGHSLLLVLVHETLQQRLEREVAIADLFKFPTVRALARHLSGSSPKQEESSLNRRRAGERQAALKGRNFMKKGN